MKRIYVNEKWCLACHLCEYYCAFANADDNKEHKGRDNSRAMALLLKDVVIHPRIRVEEKGPISFAVSCRHCTDPLCVKGCITGALSVKNGVISIDHDKCVGCYTCIMMCPYGAIMPSTDGAVQKCELCVKNAGGEPACVKGCPNRAIVFEDRGE